MKWLTELVMPNWLRFVLFYVLPLAIILGIAYAIYSWGVTVEHDRNTATENKQLADTVQKNFKLQTKAREDEREHVKYVNELTINYEKRINDAETKTKSALHDVATGALKLRIGTRTSVPACSGITSTTGTAASGTTETTTELSQSASEFLIGFANDCDKTAEKLNLAIDIAQGDRKEIHPNTSTESEVESAHGRVIPSSSSADLLATQVDTSTGSNSDEAVK